MFNALKAQWRPKLRAICAALGLVFIAQSFALPYHQSLHSAQDLSSRASDGMKLKDELCGMCAALRMPHQASAIVHASARIESAELAPSSLRFTVLFEAPALRPPSRAPPVA